VARDFGQGGLNRTGAPLDLGVQGPGFFKVSTPQGERYTRDGRFRTDDAGRLVTQGGQPVLDEGGGEIALDPEKGQVSIAQDGTVSQNSQQIGKIGLIDFADLSGLEKTGDNLYQNTSNLQPQPVEGSTIRQGMLEGSNVQPIREITRMIEVSRAYESVAKMMDSQADLAASAIQRMGRVQ
jgi:flagellar basal-body rod protein FlgF